MLSYSNHRSCISGIQQLARYCTHTILAQCPLSYLFVGFESPIQKKLLQFIGAHLGINAKLFVMIIHIFNSLCYVDLRSSIKLQQHLSYVMLTCIAL